MTEIEIISWILLAIALGSQKEKIDLKGIIMLADGINHSIPTESELQLSIKWLLKNDLIEKTGKKYSLSANGKKLYNECKQNTNVLFKIWENLELEINHLR